MEATNGWKIPRNKKTHRESKQNTPTSTEGVGWQCVMGVAYAGVPGERQLETGRMEGYALLFKGEVFWTNDYKEKSGQKCPPESNRTRNNKL